METLTINLNSFSKDHQQVKKKGCIEVTKSQLIKVVSDLCKTPRAIQSSNSSSKGTVSSRIPKSPINLNGESKLLIPEKTIN
jgi:hypothetical protein